MKRFISLAAAAAAVILAAGARAEEPASDDPAGDALGALLSEAQEPLHRCWEKGAADDFHLEGEITLRLTVGKGKAKKVEVAEDIPGDKVLTACVVDLFKKRPLPKTFAAGDVVELPLEFVSPGVQYTVRTEDAPLIKPKGGKLQATVLLDKASVGAERASLMVLQLSGRTELTWHRHSSAEVIYVLQGQARIYSPDTGKKGVMVQKGDAFYVPARAAHKILSISGKNKTRLAVLYSPGGPEQLFETPALAKENPDLTYVDKGEPDAPGQVQLKLVKASEATELAIAGGKGKVRMFFDQESVGDGAAYLGWISLDPGAEVPEHQHDSEAEILYVLAGAGEMVVNGELVPVVAGMAVHVPPGAKHSFKVTSSVAFEAIQSYAPSGPEQRFKGTK